jgi:hypothetical protein
MSREFRSLLNPLAGKFGLIDSRKGSSFPLGTGDAELAKSVVNRRLLKETCVADSAIAGLYLKACVLVDIDEFLT